MPRARGKKMIAARIIKQDFAGSHLLEAAIIRSSVDLPQPDGPTKTVNEPSSTVRSTP